MLGSTEIDKIERLFDIEPENEEFTTIAGLVTSEVGYVPKPGERMTTNGLDVEVPEATKNVWSCCRSVQLSRCVEDNSVEP